MSWLGGKRIAFEVSQALALESESHVLVAFDSKLAARLGAAGARVTFVSDVPREVQRATTPAIELAALDTVDDVTGAVLVGVCSRDDRDVLVSTFADAITGDAKIALVDRVQRKVAARAALLGGLSNLEQRGVGRVVITSGCRIEARSPASLES